MSPQQHFVIGTAGHIDHGKTTLVRALTGVDLDSLPEERARGITIALGFTQLDLGPDHQLSFVDVPGHERLVRTMIAGASGLDAVMLCVSAVDGVMPQTREHLHILQILGIQQGVIALTMTDLVDEEMRELAELDVEETVAGTFLEGAPIVSTAVPPGDQAPTGLDALRTALAALRPRRHAGAGPLRMPIDRAFLRHGFGTVVTGTVRSGAVSDGDEVEVLPTGLRTRVRGLQVHGQAVQSSTAGQRTAINLAGVERDDLNRGQVVVHPGSLKTASVIDTHYRHLDGAAPIKDQARVRMLAGTAEVMAVVSVLSSTDPSTPGLSPGHQAMVQLRTETPLVLLPGDRFVLRRESPVETLGGGRVLDPWAPRARKRDRATAAAQLQALAAGDKTVLLARAGDAGLSLDHGNLLGVDSTHADAVLLGDRLLHRPRVEQLADQLQTSLTEWHRTRPLTPGAPRRDLRRGSLAHLDERTFDALIGWCEARGEVHTLGPVLCAKDFEIRPDPSQQATLLELQRLAREAGLEGSPVAPMLSRDADAFMLLVSSGDLIRVADRAIHKTAMNDLRARLMRFFQTSDQLRPADFKEISGQSRRMAIPLLEWLDAQHVTVRQDDHRRLYKKS